MGFQTKLAIGTLNLIYVRTELIGIILFLLISIYHAWFIIWNYEYMLATVHTLYVIHLWDFHYSKYHSTSLQQIDMIYRIYSTINAKYKFANLKWNSTTCITTNNSPMWLQPTREVTSRSIHIGSPLFQCTVVSVCSD